MAEPSGRVLALDLGEARIGVAVSDPDRTVALPHGTIAVTGGIQDLKAVAALSREVGAAEVVVGHPRSLSGGRGPAAMRAEQFAAGLRLLVDVPVRLQDERLSTAEAEGRLRTAGVRDRRRSVDATAAAVILEAYLAGPGGKP